MSRQMKDSGIEWIGEIPEKWELKRLKSQLVERKEKNEPVKTDFILSLGANYGIIPYSDKEGGGNKAKEDLTDYRLAYPGDIVMNSMNILSGSVGMSEYFGCVSPVYYMFYPRSEEVCTEYFYLIFQSKAFQRSLLGLGNGILIKESSNGNFNTVRMRIPVNKLNSLMLPIPSYSEQKRIATYLGQQCAYIDAVIEKTKASIEEYKKLKQAVITQAVTKGIRGDRPMKDSGIEWISELPKDWEIKRFKFVVDSLVKGNGIAKDDVRENGDIPCVRYGEIYTKYDNSFKECVSATNEELIGTKQYFSYGDLLFTCTGELVEEIGKSITYIGNEQCLAGGDIIIARHHQNPVFLNYALNSAYTQAQKSCNKNKLKVVHISASDIANIVIVLPTMEEQEEIAQYLDEKCGEIKRIIEAKQQQLQVILDYKKSLIYEYVTGKKEVPQSCQ